MPYENKGLIFQCEKKNPGLFGLELENYQDS